MPETSSSPASAVVLRGDCFNLFSTLGDGTVDAVITDPPYFLDGMGDTWDEAMIGRKTTSNQRVASLRGGMKFDKQQGRDFQEFMNRIGTECQRILKPGGWFISFSAPRLYHRLAVGIEDAGYEIRDMWEWLYTQNQMKAMSVARSMVKDDTLNDDQRAELATELEFWKTPQVKSCFEPIVMAQKPREGTFYENWKLHHVGLVRFQHDDNSKVTSNVMTTEELMETLDKPFLVGKPTKAEKGDTGHLSVKPLALMEHLVAVTVPAGGVVLDPFNGSGSTGIAALHKGRSYVGFEKDDSYFNQSAQRFAKDYEVNMEADRFTTGERLTHGLF